MTGDAWTDLALVVVVFAGGTLVAGACTGVVAAAALEWWDTRRDSRTGAGTIGRRG